MTPDAKRRIHRLTERASIENWTNGRLYAAIYGQAVEDAADAVNVFNGSFSDAQRAALMAIIRSLHKSEP